MAGLINSTEGILFTDFYQLTMAQLYHEAGMHSKEVQFEYFFRTYPDYGEHKAGYCVNCGLQSLIEWMQGASFTDKDIDHLKKHKGSNNKPIFKKRFLSWLRENGNFKGLSMRAIPEGRVVHPNVPLVVVEGPFAMAQILESSLLNHLNFQTLVATKAARIKDASENGVVIDFGMRRAQGKGANEASRAALIGGAEFSSNSGLSYSLGYLPKGTHAHSMVQAYMAQGYGELKAFQSYADLYPDDCLLLVDTIDTLKSGIPNAIKVFKQLKKKGHKPVGIRLDSGDLAYLSIQAVRMLDRAGFKETLIVLSNELDELVIWQILSQIRKESSRYGVNPGNLIKRLVYGVGTRLATSAGDSSLDGVYKLTAVKQNNSWLPAIKISEVAAKTINPGFKKIFRIYDKRKKATADLIALDGEDISRQKEILLYHPIEPSKIRRLGRVHISEIEALLVDIIKKGKTVYSFPSIENIRQMRDKDLDRLDAGIRRLINPHIYHISLSQGLWELKQKLTKNKINSYK
ncbi:MAG: nicotinate phosphoribosyltransferase [Candidatus Omnitrophica bacterium]|nr:nicotinate phosphoribosyltransferase [Candidatus Omnitrophota bacterium]